MPSFSGCFSSPAFTTRWGSDIVLCAKIASADNSRSNKKPPLGVGPMFPRFSGQDIADDCLGRVIEVARLAPTGMELANLALDRGAR